MTKKDFIAVAEIIREHGNILSINGDFDDGAKFAANRIARELAKVFKQQNPRFDTARFLEACGAE